MGEETQGDSNIVTLFPGAEPPEDQKTDMQLIALAIAPFLEALQKDEISGVFLVAPYKDPETHSHEGMMIMAGSGVMQAIPNTVGLLQIAQAQMISLMSNDDF